MEREERKDRRKRTSGKRARKNFVAGVPGHESLLFNQTLAATQAANISGNYRSRVLFFAHQVTSRHRESIGANTFKFLDTYFGAKFSAIDAHQLSASPVYRRQGNIFWRSSHTSFTRYVLSLCMTQLVQDFNFWFSRLLRIQELTTLLSSVQQREPSIQPASHHAASPVLLPRTTETPQGLKEVLTLSEKFSREVLNRPHLTMKNQNRFITQDAFKGKSAATIWRLSSSLVNETHATHLFAIQTKHPATPLHDLRRISSAPGVFVPTQASVRHFTTRVYSSTPLSQQFVSTSTQGDAMQEMMLERVLALQSVHNTTGTQRESQMARLSGKKETAFITRWLGRPHLLEPNLFSEQLSATAPLKIQAVRILPTATRLLKAGSADIERTLTRLRRETNLEFPPLGYVFTQTVRPQVDEQKAIKRIEEREVVEVVRREVQTLMRSGSSLMNFTRADYATITDQVYSALARRLLTEKERLGLRA